MDRKIARAGLWLFLTAFSALNPYHLKAQKLIFEKIPETAPTHPHYGPNKTHFLHPFLSGSLILPSVSATNVQINFPLSGEIAAGYRYKLRMSGRLALITEAGLDHIAFDVRQKQGKTYPDSLIHRSQSLRSNGLTGGMFVRLRLGQNGDYLGNYLDLGITGYSPFLSSIRTIDRQATGMPIPVTTEKIAHFGFNELNRPSAGVKLRIGFNRFALYVERRFTRWLPGTATDDLPILKGGAEISLVTY